MAFKIDENLHPELMPLAWIVGQWRGTGRGEYPTMQPFTYEHEVVFNHDGRNFLNYYSRTWILDGDGKVVKPGPTETGFWRPKENKTLEVLLAHSNGIAEGWVGVYDEQTRIQLAMDQGYSAPSANIVTAGSRLYGLVEGELFYSYDMAAEGQTLQAYVWSTLKRQDV